MLQQHVFPGSAVTGVGLELTFDESSGTQGYLVVVTPVAAGPADRAGLRAGDVITAIDGKSTQGLSLYEASDLLKGEENSQVCVRVSVTLILTC